MTHTFESVNENIVRALPLLVEELGGDAAALLQRVGLSLASVLNGEIQPSYRQAVELMGLAAGELKCPDFGMRLARAQAGTIRSPLVRVVESARTLEEALRLMCAHSYAHSLAVTIWLEDSPFDETVAYGLNILLDDLPNRSQAMEQVMLLAYATLQQATGGMVRAQGIAFRHEPVSPLAIYRRYFGCKVRFGEPADAIILSRADLARPILHGDGEDAQAILAAVRARLPGQQPPVHAKVRGILMNRIGIAPCTIGDAAASMGCSSKKLSRMLEAEGTSFQRIKNKIRIEIARYCIEETGLDFTVVSERMGFSEQSALTHFCRKWLGGSPSKLRLAAQGKSGE